ncbi:MAG: argininosuccinate lyase [Chlorobi bacterium]|nr:argininosuccinate lyase [Chlorobiota bacterium]
MSHQTLWGGRFKEGLAEIALAFSTSIALDGRLYREDIAGSVAHVEMLGATGIITPAEAATIREALLEIEGEIASGEFVPAGEDVHLAIEGRLIGKIGPLGGKLHTARSRNDQVALDERLYLRTALRELNDRIAALQGVLVAKAGEYADVVMPGYTHMQRAQPILLAHHLLAYVAMLGRDAGRLDDAARRMNLSPLGAAAFAGTSFPIDRAMVAGALGFDGIVGNSIDAVSDRDYIIETAAACGIIMMHLSRMAEEYVLWATKEFGFLSIGDAFATGSSIMPQKKNPDMAELVRGRTGRVYGALVNLLTMMKGLPLAYNRDMQEDKGAMFEAIDTTLGCLEIFAHLLESTSFNRDRMESEALADLSTATELADYLVRRGLPFRDAHAVAGRLVGHCVENGIGFGDLDLAGIREFSPAFDQDVFDYLLPRASVARKRSAGSTSPAEVERQIAGWREHLAKRNR